MRTTFCWSLGWSLYTSFTYLQNRIVVHLCQHIFHFWSYTCVLLTFSGKCNVRIYPGWCSCHAESESWSGCSEPGANWRRSRFPPRSNYYHRSQYPLLTGCWARLRWILLLLHSRVFQKNNIHVGSSYSLKTFDWNHTCVYKSCK